MTTDNRCGSCGKTVAADALMGLCPDCLLKAGVATGSEADGRFVGNKFVPPTPAELARYFPQLEILELIGRGGMGAVYKARQKQLDRFVAVKILPPGIGHDPAFAERFAREAKALAKLNHPNIVAIYDFGQADGLFYFLMEFVNGLNLRQLLDAGRVAPREALAIVPQICDALQYAHDAGIVHRDIKPENILLDRQGRVKVADFGLAKLVSQSGTGILPVESEATLSATGKMPVPADITEAGKVMGTPPYMAPEQTERPTEVDHRADIYSLGVVFYQMLTGELPAGKLFEPPSRKVLIDVRLDEVVLRALEKEPKRRYQQANDVKTMVETILTSPQQQTTAQAVRPAQPPKGFAQRAKRVAWSILLAAVLALTLRAFVLAPYRVVGDAVYPEIPQDSYALVFKLARAYAPGDIVCYREGGKAMVGRVAQAGSVAGALQIERRAGTPQSVSISSVLGRVIFNTRAEASKKQEPQTQAVRSRFPKSTRIGQKDGTVLCQHDDVDAHYVFFYPGDCDVSAAGSHNTHSLTWMDRGTITLKNGRTFGYQRESTDEFHLSVNGQEVDLRRGRVLVLHDDGAMEQLKLFPPLSTANSPDALAKIVTSRRAMNEQPVILEKLVEPSAGRTTPPESVPLATGPASVARVVGMPSALGAWTMSIVTTILGLLVGYVLVRWAWRAGNRPAGNNMDPGSRAGDGRQHHGVAAVIKRAAGGLVLLLAVVWSVMSPDIAAIRFHSPWSENLFRPDKVMAMAITLGLLSLGIGLLVVRKRNAVRVALSAAIVWLLLFCAVLFSGYVAVVRAARMIDIETLSHPTVVEFTQGVAQFTEGDSIAITEVLAQKGTFAVGDTITVKGTYTLASRKNARLLLSVTQVVTKERPLAKLGQGLSFKDIAAGEGDFKMTITIPYEGRTHLGLYDLGTGTPFGQLYFGLKGQQGNLARQQKSALSNKLDSIVIPTVQFVNTKVKDAVWFLVAAGKENDPDRTGVNIALLDKENQSTITLTLEKASLHNVLKLVAEQGKLSLALEDGTVVLRKPKETMERGLPARMDVAGVAAILPEALIPDPDMAALRERLAGLDPDIARVAGYLAQQPTAIGSALAAQAVEALMRDDRGRKAAIDCLESKSHVVRINVMRALSLAGDQTEYFLRKALSVWDRLDAKEKESLGHTLTPLALASTGGDTAVRELAAAVVARMIADPGRLVPLAGIRLYRDLNAYVGSDAALAALRAQTNNAIYDWFENAHPVRKQAMEALGIEYIPPVRADTDLARISVAEAKGLKKSAQLTAGVFASLYTAEGPCIGGKDGYGWDSQCFPIGALMESGLDTLVYCHPITEAEKLPVAWKSRDAGVKTPILNPLNPSDIALCDVLVLRGIYNLRQEEVDALEAFVWNGGGIVTADGAGIIACGDEPKMAALQDMRKLDWTWGEASEDFYEEAIRTPLTEGLDFTIPLKGARGKFNRNGYTFPDERYQGQVLLRFKLCRYPALRVSRYGKGRVAHVAWTVSYGDDAAGRRERELLRRLALWASGRGYAEISPEPVFSRGRFGNR